MASDLGPDTMEAVQHQVPLPLHPGEAKLALERLESHGPGDVALPVPQSPVCSEDEESLDGGQVSPRHGQVEGGLALAVHRVDLGPLAQQSHDTGQPPGPDHDVEDGAATAVPGLEVAARLQQATHQGFLSGPVCRGASQLHLLVVDVGREGVEKCLHLACKHQNDPDLTRT